MIDLTLTIMGAEVVEAEDHVELALLPAIGFPTGNGVLPIQLGVIRVPMRRNDALRYAEKLKEAAEKLNDTPTAGQKTDLVIANSMAGIDKAAQQQQKFRGDS